MWPQRDATLHGGGTEEVVRRRIEAVQLDGAFLGELAGAAQEAEHAAADGADETFDVGVADRGDRMEARVNPITLALATSNALTLGLGQ